MGENNLKIRIKHRYDTEANWNKNNPVLLSGEVAISSDKSGKHKVGDGTHKWSELSYAKAELTKGDVTGALGYTPPAKDTWRGIQNNLISTATDQSLSAAQGKWLNENKATITTLTNGNLDKITTPGFYNAGGGNSVTNKPSGVDNFGMIVVHSAFGNYYTQIVYVDDKSYRRICRNGTWGNWSQDILTDTKYTHPGYTAKSSGLYKITVDGTGHVSATTAVTKSDITALGIPGQDTNTTYSTGTSSTPGLAKLYTGTGSATDGTMTQNAITTALNGKSPTSHTHNYAGSSSSGGAANSANKLATARTVSGGTDITLSFNYDGSGNSSANIGFYSSSASVGDKNNYPFHRFAKLDTIAASYSDKSTTFFISQDYSGGGFGIVRIVLRTNNSSLASTVEVKWLVRCGLSADSVQVGIYNVFGKTYADAFFKTGGSYAGTCFRTLASGARGGISRTWVLVNSSEVSGTSATDAKTSTECYATIAAAGTALHKQAYSSIVSGTDSGTASYANSAGSANSVAWGNVTGKPSTFAPSSHTHNYAGSSSAGGAADSAIKLNTSRNITIGNSTKSFDGTTNLSWSLNEIGIPTKSDIAACAVMYGGTTLSSSATVTDSAAQYKVISRSTGSTGDIFTKSVTLPKGLYSVMIRMKVSTISSSSNVFKLTIIDGSTTTTKYIKPNMFKAEDSYTTLGTAVENTSGTLKITLNVYSALSNQTVCVDYLAIAPTMVGVTSIA